MRLLVLAGGFGKRLRKVVTDLPKALAPVCEVPFLQLQLECWVSQGLDEFTLLLHHEANQLIDFVRGNRAEILQGCQVNWLVERTPLDTGGAIAHAVKELELSDDFLIANADTWLGGGVKEILESAAPAMAVVKLLDTSRYGRVHFEQSARVTAFSEKTLQSEPGWINAGLCHLHAELFKDWNGKPFSLERTLFAELVQSRSLKAIPLETDFIDIGVPDDYHRFCRWIAGGRRVPLCN
jgi:NDP-sugar pyrophosphorylase family protein